MENSLLPPESESSFTFLVDPVDLCEEAPYMSPVEDVLRKKILTIDNKTKPWDPPSDYTGKFEDCSHRKDMNANFISPDIPGMIAAIHAAFQSHYALSLSASDFIVLIGQGLGAHINKNAEKLRKYFVDHEGKDQIAIDRDDFVLGGQNDWSTVFGEFAEQIKKRVKADVYDMIVDDTSIATPTSRIVSEITLMDAMKGYFSYDVFTSCGIPQITLEGKREDWQKLKDKVGKLVEMNKDDCLDLNWWLDKLVPVVDKICEAGIDREVDEEFWENIYKYCGGSGGDRVNGWITRFFPYVSEERNKFRDEKSAFGGIGTSNIPRQVSEVPFRWIYLGKEIPMKFTAGFLGAEFNKELCQVKPAYFWCVTEDEEKKL